MAKSDHMNNPERKRSAEEALASIKRPKAHEKLEKVLRHPQLQAALDELHGNPEKRKEASRDIAGYLARKGVELPEGVTVELKDDNWSFWVCWGDGTYTCCVWFDWWWGWAGACS